MERDAEGSWEIIVDDDKFYLTQSELAAILHIKHVSANRGEALFGDMVIRWQRHWLQPPDRDTQRIPHAFARLLGMILGHASVR